MDVQAWATLVKQFGIQTIALIWVAVYILLPVRDGHLEFLKKSNENQEKLHDSLVEGDVRYSKRLDDIHSGVDGLHKKVDTVIERQGRQ